jgi:hypothetical protein
VVTAIAEKKGQLTVLKKLRPIGNSYGIITDRPIMDLLGIDANTQFEVTT